MSNRKKVISRVQKELIGPGSDLFECSDKVHFSDEIIADKPLLRYYSGKMCIRDRCQIDQIEINVIK